MTTTVRDALTMPWDTTVCLPSQAPAPVAREAAAATSSSRPAWTLGLEPSERAPLPGYDSGVLTVVLVAFLVLTLNFRHYSTFLKNFAQDLWSVRRRESIFDDHTVSETRIQMSLILVCVVAEGILLATAAGPGAAGMFARLLTCTGVAAAYYVWQLAAYRVVGYAFATAEGARLWLKGFNASQSLLGLAMIVPAVLVLFNPGASGWVLTLGVVLYILARVIFIVKGFRLFYDNLLSWVYFILYLCTLEICPLVLLLKFAAPAVAE